MDLEFLLWQYQSWVSGVGFVLVLLAVWLFFAADNRKSRFLWVRWIMGISWLSGGLLLLSVAWVADSLWVGLPSFILGSLVLLAVGVLLVTAIKDRWGR